MASPRTPDPLAEATIGIHPATSDRFDDMAALIGPRKPDAPACWCLYYRLSSSEFSRLRGEERPNRLRALCEREPAPGVILYVDGVPAGWCAFGPRTEMERLVRSRTIQKVDETPVWSIVCLVVRTGYRRQGLDHRLVRGVIDYAREQGAAMLETYPFDTGGQRVSTAFAYCGTTGLFEAAGFERVAETTAKSAGLTRWIYRLRLAPGR